MESEVALADKIAFLRRADAYADAPASVETIETHFAWVFLGERFVYKLKKPIRFERIDLTALESRRASCELELTLNRRLAESTYLAIVPLTLSAAGLAIGAPGTPVDWLVKMHRLPGDRTLEAAAMQGVVSDAELRAVTVKLARFYAHTPAAPFGGAEYVEILERRSAEYAERLSAPELGLERALIERIAAAQREFLAHRAEALERRVVRGRVVDAHGDLRPEHVFLGENPQIIDCLEFSIELRWLDTAEELAFLALECERLGAPALGERILELYREACDDDVAPALCDFYFGQRAVVRALLCAWHVADAEPTRGAQWRERARWYLRRAEERTARANART